MSRKSTVKYNVFDQKGKRLLHLVTANTVADLLGVTATQVTKYFYPKEEGDKSLYHGYIVERVFNDKDDMADLWKEFEEITRKIREA